MFASVPSFSKTEAISLSLQGMTLPSSPVQVENLFRTCEEVLF